MTTMIEKVRAARGDRDALLAFANEETVNAIRDEKDLPAQRFASELAMRLFDSKSVTIHWTQVVYGKSIKRRLDLTRGDHAIRAIKLWGMLKASLDAWHAVGEDQKAYGALLAENRKKFGKEIFYSGIVTSMKLTRHRK